MNTTLKSTSLVLGLIATLSAASPASAGEMCMSSCNDRNLTCGSSGRSDGACLSAWHQCKVACATPAKAAPVRAKAAPTSAPRVMKASTHA